MNKLLVIFFLFACLSCTKDPAMFTLNNLNNNQINCFGHAGMGTQSIYPLNSCESLQSCLNTGSDGTEMDIQVTKDSVLVIFHDENLSSNTSCSGIIKDLNWSDISDCKLQSIWFKDLQLTSFDEFIQKVEDPFNHIYTLDCKSRINVEGNEKIAYFQLFARTLVKTIEKYHLESNVYIENLESSFLNEIKKLSSDTKLYLLAFDFDRGYDEVVKYGFYGLSMHNLDINIDQVKKAHSKNLRVTLYGVLTDQENYSAVEKSPDNIQTDGIIYLTKILGKYKGNSGYLQTLSK